jgi:hypothetical protein
MITPNYNNNNAGSMRDSTITGLAKKGGRVVRNGILQDKHPFKENKDE